MSKKPTIEQLADLIKEDEIDEIMANMSGGGEGGMGDEGVEDSGEEEMDYEGDEGDVAADEAGEPAEELPKIEDMVLDVLADHGVEAPEGLVDDLVQKVFQYTEQHEVAEFPEHAEDEPEEHLSGDVDIDDESDDEVEIDDSEEEDAVDEGY